MKNERPVYPLAQNLGQALLDGVIGEKYPTNKSIANEWNLKTGISQSHAHRILEGSRVTSAVTFGSFLSAFKLEGDHYENAVSTFAQLVENGLVALDDKSPSQVANEHLAASQRRRRAREKAKREETLLQADIEYQIAS